VTLAQPLHVASLPGVTITATSPNVGGTFSAVSDGEGNYRLINLPAGADYQVTAVLEGFSRFERTGLVVRAGLNVALDISLQVGALSETLTVKGDTPLLEVFKAEQNVNISGELVRALPLTGRRDWSDVLQLAPGTLSASTDRFGGQVYFLRGSENENHVAAIDGADIGSFGQNWPSRPCSRHAIGFPASSRTIAGRKARTSRTTAAVDRGQFGGEATGVRLTSVWGDAITTRFLASYNNKGTNTDASIFDGLGSGPSRNVTSSVVPSAGRLQGTGTIAVLDNLPSRSLSPASKPTISGDITWYRPGSGSRFGSHEVQAGFYLQPHLRQKQTTIYSNGGFTTEDLVLRDAANPGGGLIPYHRVAPKTTRSTCRIRGGPRHA
jgi:hypothetical protein